MNKRELETYGENDLQALKRINHACNEFNAAWQPGSTPILVDYLTKFHGQERADAFLQLLKRDIENRKQLGCELDERDYLEQFPEYADSILLFFDPTQAVPEKRPASETISETKQPEELIADRFLLEKPIGQGGMGTVFKARQLKPVQRTVALKVIRAGMDSAAVLLRFEAERQALALMDHPNIAKVLDAGKTRDGQPFFVMEFVDGDRITDYCQNGKLALQKRLELFVHVCDALEHAHRKGIIHRDIKPSNVLIAEVDESPVAKVIDFGVAKAISQRLTEDTIQTEIGHLVGTPEYMSPEQANLSDQDIDTRSDVYALGILLFELLTSTTPIDSRSSDEPISVLEILRRVREEDPPRVSQRMNRSSQSTVQGHSRLPIHPDTGIPRKRIERELDWIVKKALEKDRGMRYQSVADLSSDVVRFMAGDPIAAHPPSRIYRLRKFVSKHKTVVVASLLLFLSLVAGILGTSWGMLTARQQTIAAVEANKETQKALKIATDNSQFALDTLSNVVFNLNEQLEQIPNTELVRRQMLKQVYDNLDRFSQDLMDRDVADHAVVVTHIKLANLFRRVGDEDGLNSTSKAESNMLRAMKIARKIYARSDQRQAAAKTLAHAAEETGLFYTRIGKLNEAEEPTKLNLKLREELFKQDPEDSNFRFRLIAALFDHGDLLAQTNRMNLAEPLYLRMKELLTPLDETPDLPIHVRQAKSACFFSLASIHIGRNELREAKQNLQLAQNSAESLAKDFPDDPRSWLNVAEIQTAMGDVFLNSNDFESAESHFKNAIESHQKGMDAHPDRMDLKEYQADAQVRLAESLLEQKKDGEAEPILKSAIATLKPICQADRERVWSHGTLSLAYEHLAKIEYRMKNRDRAIETMKQSLETLQAGQTIRENFSSEITTIKQTIARWQKQKEN